MDEVTTNAAPAPAAAPAPDLSAAAAPAAQTGIDTSAESAQLAALADALPPAAPIAAAAPAVAEEVPRSQLFTYPDGSQVVGVPPFPEMSPLQLQAKKIRDETPPQDTFARQQAEEELARKPAAARANMVTGAQIEATKPAA